MRSAMLYGLRKQHGINQFQAAEIAGCSRAAYQHKEDDIEKFTLGEAIKLSAYFNKSLEEVFGITSKNKTA